jgi:hypothetical protein
MSSFRLVIYRPGTQESGAFGEVIGYSDPIDLVTGTVTCTLMRTGGHRVQLMPNTRPLQREAEKFWREHPVTGILTFCSCGSANVVPLQPAVSPEMPVAPPATPEEPCDGK